MSIKRQASIAGAFEHQYRWPAKLACGESLLAFAHEEAGVEYAGGRYLRRLRVLDQLFGDANALAARLGKMQHTALEA
jgi:hypothetical protein